MKLRKQLLPLLLSTALLLAVFALPAAAVSAAAEDLLPGDLNGDGQRTALDYIMLKRHVLGSYRIPEAFLAAADLNGNGVPDAPDYMLLKRAVLGTYLLPDGGREPSEEPSEALRFAIAFSLFYRTASSDRLIALEGELGIRLNALNELVISYLASLSIDGDELLRLENEIAFQLEHELLTPEDLAAFAASLAEQISAWLQSVLPSNP